MRDGLINYLGPLAAGLAGLVLVPLLLRGLGTELYGLWIAAYALTGMVSGFDFGLGVNITREVAATLGGGSREAAAQFVWSAGNAYVAIGAVGGFLITALGILMSRGLHLSAYGQTIVPVVFGSVGAAFLAERLVVYAKAVLTGLRRFDAANLISTGNILLRAAGMVVILLAGRGIVSLAVWHVIVMVIGAAAALYVVGRLDSNFHFRLGHFNWGAIRSRIPFGLSSQLTSTALTLVWEPAALLIGLVLGPSWIVPFHIGQKFPLAISQVSWCAGEVLFPAASAHAQAQQGAHLRESLEVGTRWSLVLVLPLCIVLWIIAPNLLPAWLGRPLPEAVPVMRLLTLAVFADALGVGALYFLWGRGAAGTLLVILGGMTVINLGLSAGLLFPLGIAGPAWGMLISMALGSVALVHLATRSCQTTLLPFARSVSNGLLLPVTSCAATAVGINYFVHPGNWVGIVAIALGAGSIYTTCLYFSGAREEERICIKDLIGLPAAIARPSFRLLRRVLRRVGFVRSE